MLVLAAKVGEEIFISDDIKVKLVSIGDGEVKLGFDVPKHFNVLRGTLKTKLVRAGIAVYTEKNK